MGTVGPKSESKSNTENVVGSVLDVMGKSPGPVHADNPLPWYVSHLMKQSKRERRIK